MIGVFGHKNPDTDAICAAITYATYLQYTGKAATPYALWKANNETLFVLNYRNMSMPEIIDTLPENTKVALVDHNEASQSIDARDSLDIAIVIDHHKVADFNTSSPLYMRLEPVGCTCTVLHNIFREQRYTPSPQIAGLMISAIISDTLYFRSPTTTEDDKNAVAALNEIAVIEDLEKYSLEMFAEKSDLGDMPAAQLLTIDYKVFELNDIKIGYGVMETTNPGYAMNRKEELLNAMKDMKSKDDLAYILFSVIDILNEKNHTFILWEPEAKLVKAVYGSETHNNVADLWERISRKKQLIPPLDEYLQNNSQIAA